ncbi:MAG TPA: dUTP diphosphatase [Bacillota bacterium]|nr:dUTP diphosphatase [Bacillota bacterium]
MELKIKKLHENAIPPKYAHLGDAGMDLFSASDLSIEPGEAKLVPTGIAMELPKGTEGQVRPRSGLALKYQITVLNSPGTIDEGYRGELGVIIINHGKGVFHVKAGMKIAQLVIQKVLRVKIEEHSCLSDSQRDQGGFGSTGL